MLTGVDAHWFDATGRTGAGNPCAKPGQFGGDAAAVKYDYDPKKAKELLAEAGHSNGFDVEMLTYVQLTSWPAAVQNHLQAVRICAKIQLQVAPAIDKSHRGEAPLYMGSWGSYSINDVSAILPMMFSKGAPRWPERRDPANPAPATGEQPLTSRPWRGGAAPIWGRNAGLHQSAAHAHVRRRAFAGGHRGHRR